ncbi:MAG TPA: hypothetical protein VF774_14740, partial [Pseudoduganella sp.]
MAGKISFRVAGTRLDDGAVQARIGGRDLALRSAWSVHGHRAAGQPAVVDVEPGRDAVVLKIAGGPTLVLHPEHARTLLGRPSTGPASRSTPARGTVPGQDGAVSVTSQLPWCGAPTARRDGRAPVVGAVLEWFGVLAAPDQQVQQGPEDEQAAAITEAVDGQVVEGLYRLRADVLPERLPPSQRVTAWPEDCGTAPLLVFMHGTFVDTGSTFGKMWLRNAAQVEQLFEHYPERVFAFDHPTIGKSPIGNAIALVDSLPHNAVLHLVTHSRAGLIADVLLRAARFEPDATLDALFAGEPAARQELGELRRRLRSKTITVQRVVRCACPARGTLLASRRLDAYLSVLQWLMGLAGVNVTTQFVDLLCAVARRRTSAAAMPGLQAMMPDSALVRWLNAPLDGVDSELYVLAGDADGDGVLSWVKTLMADGFFWADNDMVVQTRSMYGGVPRAAGPRAPKFRLFTGAQATHFSYFSRPDVMGPVLAALRGEAADDWKPIGARSRAGLDSGGVRGGMAAAPRAE